MTSFCRHLSAQEIVNWGTTADGCVHTDDTTKMSPTSCEFVFTPPTPTRQNSFVASASAVCIGLNRMILNNAIYKQQNLEKLKSHSLFLKVATLGAWTICDGNEFHCSKYLLERYTE